ncbi:MAG: ABC transporter substrate-binding protein [Pseudonocardiaceae bacterium]
MEKIPRIGHEQSAGSVEVTLEQVLAQRPDLVIGLSQPAAETGVTRDALTSAGIPVIELPSFCLTATEALKNPDFENVYAQMELYGRLFGAEEQAARTVADLRRRVAAVQDSTRGLSGRTAAALFVTPGSSIVYAYGDGSMFDAQIDTLGLTNLFGDVKQRVFEVNLEEVLAKDPEVVMLAYTSGESEKIKEAFLGIAGIDRVRAVRNDEILVLRFEYTDPPTPLSVEGLEIIAKKFAGTR